MASDNESIFKIFDNWNDIFNNKHISRKIAGNCWKYL